MGNCNWKMDADIRDALDRCFGLMMQVNSDDGKITSCTLEEFNKYRKEAERKYYEVTKKYHG